jgi:phosphatidylglycerophosphate synthase
MTRYERFRREVLNLPNMITIGRLFLIPPVLLWMDIGGPVPVRDVVVLVFMLGGGARHHRRLAGAAGSGLVTVFGKFVDPLADKVMVAAVLVYLAADGRMPPWLVAVLLTREFYINGLRSLASTGRAWSSRRARAARRRRRFRWTGICFLLVHYRYRMPGFDEMIDFHRMGLIMLTAVGVPVAAERGRVHRGHFREALASRSRASDAGVARVGALRAGRRAGCRATPAGRSRGSTAATSAAGSGSRRTSRWRPRSLGVDR